MTLEASAWAANPHAGVAGKILVLDAGVNKKGVPMLQIINCKTGRPKKIVKTTSIPCAKVGSFIKRSDKRWFKVENLDGHHTYCYAVRRKVPATPSPAKKKTSTAHEKTTADATGPATTKEKTAAVATVVTDDGNTFVRV